MRIGIILRYLWVAGAPKIAIYQTKGLIEQKHDAELIILAVSPRYKGEYDFLLHDRIPSFYVTTSRLIEKIELVLNNELFGKWRPGERVMPFIPILLAIKYVKKYDILLCHDPFSGLLGLLSKIFLKKPYVVYLHETPFGIKRFLPFERIILNFADAVFAVSEKAAKETSIMIRRKVISLPPGLPAEKESSKQKLGKIVLTVARWDQGRRPDWIIKVAEEMKDFTFLVAGYWQSKNLYEELINKKTHNLKNLIIYQEPINEEELRKLLSSSLIVIRFNPAGEALGMIAWEAVHRGVPVIVNSSLGVARYVKIFNAGAIVNDVNEIKSIKEALIEIERNHQKYTENCLRLAEHYSLENQARVLAELLKSVLRLHDQN